jgi:SAM-dependent methyltransferase
MTTDIRAEAARYDGLNPNTPHDVTFYRGRISSPDAHVLELACGTGRVPLPLVHSCGYMHGIDVSEAMLALCRQKLQAAGVPSSKAHVERDDISNFALGRTFDLIIAPYRVLQRLETDSQVEGLFQGMWNHLRPAGTCILNVFKPYMSPDALPRAWCTEGENFVWETRVAGIRITPGTLACAIHAPVQRRIETSTCNRTDQHAVAGRPAEDPKIWLTVIV